MDYKTLELKDLWIAVYGGDEQALAELVDRFRGLIYSVSKVHGRINEDLVQDVRVGLMKAIKREIGRSREKGED